MTSHDSQAMIAAITIGSVAALGLGTSSLAQNDVAPRTEVEQLRTEVNTLEHRIEGLEQQVGPDGGFTLDTNAFKPGWERTRYDGWMEQGKLEEMSVLIGRGGPIDLYMGLQTAGRLQYLHQDDVVVGGEARPNSLEPGFQTAWGSIDFLAELYDGAMEVYFDVYLSSPPHPDSPQGHEGYMLMRQVPGAEDTILGSLFNVVDVKAGQFEIDFGDHRYRRTDNARAQRNRLIGNHVVDPKTTEIGMEVFNANPGTFNWLVGFGSGSETGGFTSGRGISTHAKIWANLDSLRIAGSGYHVHHAPDSGAMSNLYRTSRDGGVYQGVFTGNAPGQVFPGSGREVLAFQGDVTWIVGDLEIYSNVGWIRDEASAGGRDEWIYYGLEGAYYLNPRLHLAARYSGAVAERLMGESASGHVHRAQIGGGYWLYSTVLAKVEYVHQVYDGFDAGQTVSGVDAGLDPAFNGVIAEVSFAF